MNIQGQVEAVSFLVSVELALRLNPKKTNKNKLVATVSKYQLKRATALEMQNMLKQLAKDEQAYETYQRYKGAIFKSGH